MRIVVVGTSGAGNTILARRIAAQLQLPHIELDAINWQSEWRDLTRHDREASRPATNDLETEKPALPGGLLNLVTGLFRQPLGSSQPPT